MPSKKVTDEKIVKKTVKKAKTEKVESEVVSPVKDTAKKNSVSVKVLGIDGAVSGSMSLPGEIFSAKINPVLMAQAVRVYLANQRQGTSSTKTRGEVAGSTRKIYRQKGTGRARHGGVRAPIFVHGGIAFGPKPRDHSLNLPTKMKRRALFSALSAKFADNLIVVTDAEEKLTGKTKEAVSLLSALKMTKKNMKANKVLFVVGAEFGKSKMAARNIEGVKVMPAQRLNTYEVLNSNHILFMKNAVEALTNTFLKEDK